MSDFLFELFSEEIPARMQEAALTHLQNSLRKTLNVTEIQGFVTPRRLAVIIKNLPTVQPDINSELKGPKIDAPEAALNGFLKKNNLTIDQLEKRDGVYFASIRQKGKPTAEILKSIVEDILANFPWPKSMRWGSGSVTWVRPLHSILAIFDGQIVPIEFAGVTARNTTYGHRFLAPQAITINSPDEYEKALEKAFVIADRQKRKSEIAKQSAIIAASKDLTIKEDNGLLEEVVGLVEYPQVLLGKIDDKFMDLPPEVLTMVMRSHQKYFALQNADGSLSSHFLITSNMQTTPTLALPLEGGGLGGGEDAGKAIIAGNERVLRARFSDARFFWDTDRKKPLSEWAKALKTVTYHAKIGTIAQKVERVKELSVLLAESVPNADKELVARAASLCKADLTTGMVGEFAELQGIMGRYYAMQQGENQAVADAIRDHYKPLGAGDSVPTEPVSICVALADKLDTLASMFAINEKPTGSKDPFALRRAALGVIRIVLENNVRLPLVHFTNGELYRFLYDRLIVQLKERFRHGIINAIINNSSLNNLVATVNNIKILQDFVETNDGKNLLSAYKRASKIVADEEKKDNTIYCGKDISALKEPEEKDLLLLIEKIRRELQSLNTEDDFLSMITKLSELRTPLDLFFEKIRVNCDEKNLRTQRLCLLAYISDVMNTVADFSQIEG